MSELKRDVLGVTLQMALDRPAWGRKSGRDDRQTKEGDKQSAFTASLN